MREPGSMDDVVVCNANGSSGERKPAGRLETVRHSDPCDDPQSLMNEVLCFFARLSLIFFATICKCWISGWSWGSLQGISDVFLRQTRWAINFPFFSSIGNFSIFPLYLSAHFSNSCNEMGWLQLSRAVRLPTHGCGMPLGGGLRWVPDPGAEADSGNPSSRHRH